MSAQLGTFLAMGIDGSHDLHVTGFWGGAHGGKSVQLTINGGYTQLSAKQTRVLIRMLTKRLKDTNLKDSYRVVTP